MPETFCIYCYESCHLLHDHQPIMALGAVWCEASRIGEASRRLHEIRVHHRISENLELKRTKVSPACVEFYQSAGWHTRHRQLQLFTVEELLDGAWVDMPLAKQTNVTFKRAPRAAAVEAEALDLPLAHGPARAQDAKKPARPANQRRKR